MKTLLDKRSRVSRVKMSLFELLRYQIVDVLHKNFTLNNMWRDGGCWRNLGKEKKIAKMPNMLLI